MLQITSGDILIHYFDSTQVKSALAAMMIGTALGRTMYPILVQYLFDEFEYMFAILITASFMLVHIMGGAAYAETEEGLRINRSRHNTDESLKERVLLKSIKEDIKIMLPNYKVKCSKF